MQIQQHIPAEGSGAADGGPRTVLRAPDLCRLTILAQHTQVDVAVPQDVSLALLIPELYRSIVSHGNSNDFDKTPERVDTKAWVLARIGEQPLNTELSLNAQDVHDGELLMLQEASDPAPPPLFDDIMYNVASVDEGRYRRWTPTLARRSGSAIAAAATVAGCFALLWSGVGHNDLIGAVTALLVALLFLIFGVVMSRVYGDTPTATVLCSSALPTSFTAGVLFVPGGWSWPHVLLGAVLAGATAILALRVAAVGLVLFTGATAVAAMVVPATLAATLLDQPVRVIAAVLAAVALGGLALAPRLSMLLARMPLPPVPTAGMPIDPSEADPSDNHAMPTYEDLSSKTLRAHQYMAGLVGATTVVTTVAALAAAAPVDGSIYWPGTALAAVCSVVLLFRGRTYSSADEAVTLLTGGAVTAVALLIGAGIAAGGLAVAVFAAALLVALAALGLGTIAPHQTATPPMRRAVELLEYGFVAAVVPLVCWVADLYSAMRGL